jgi:hypothetical protein
MTTSPNEPVDPLVTTDRPWDEPQLADPTPYSADTSDDNASSSTTDTAKDEAKNVQAAATDSARQVAGTAQEQAAKVASDVRDQTRQLADETRKQLSGQAVDQRDRAVGGLRSLGDELRDMSDKAEQSGIGSQLAREGGDLTHKVADFIEQREPAQLLDEVRTYARRNPGTFLIGAAVAGVVVGRLTRGAIAAKQSDDSQPAIGSGDSSYLISDSSPIEDSVPAYGSAQMDQLAYPAHDIDETTSFPADQGYRA